MIKIACDNQVPFRFIGSLRQNGFDVVVRAEDEPDEDWVEAALRMRAEIFVSPDLDIPNLIQDYNGTVWLDYRSSIKNPLRDLLNRLRVVRMYFQAKEKMRRVNGG